MTTAVRNDTHTCQKGHCTFRNCPGRRRAYERNRERRIGYNDWNPTVDAEPVREHLRDLMRKGATLRSIATAAQYDHGSLGRIMWGRNNEPAPKHIRTDNAARILAVTLPQTGISILADMDATGTRRRIQALHAAGRPLARIARDFHWHETWLHEVLRAATVTVRTAAHVAARYEQLKDEPVEAAGIRPQDIRNARERAAAFGWHRPDVWDWDIDDPSADPAAPDPEVAAPSVLDLSRAEQLDVVKAMSLAGRSLQECAERIGKDVRTVSRWRRDYGWKRADP